MSKIRVNEITDLNDNLLWSASEGVGGSSVYTASGDQTLNEALQSRVIYVDTIADLQALDTTILTGGSAVEVTASPRAGAFAWQEGDQSANIASDPYALAWVPPQSDATGVSGAWRRRYTGPARIEWLEGLEFGEVVGQSTPNTPKVEWFFNNFDNVLIENVDVPVGEMIISNPPKVVSIIDGTLRTIDGRIRFDNLDENMTWFMQRGGVINCGLRKALLSQDALVGDFVLNVHAGHNMQVGDRIVTGMDDDHTWPNANRDPSHDPNFVTATTDTTITVKNAVGSTLGTPLFENMYVSNSLFQSGALDFSGSGNLTFVGGLFEECRQGYYVNMEGSLDVKFHETKFRGQGLDAFRLVENSKVEFIDCDLRKSYHLAKQLVSTWSSGDIVFRGGYFNRGNFDVEVYQFYNEPSGGYGKVIAYGTVFDAKNTLEIKTDQVSPTTGTLVTDTYSYIGDGLAVQQIFSDESATYKGFEAHNCKFLNYQRNVAGSSYTGPTTGTHLIEEIYFNGCYFDCPPYFIYDGNPGISVRELRINDATIKSKTFYPVGRNYGVRAEYTGYLVLDNDGRTDDHIIMADTIGDLKIRGGGTAKLGPEFIPIQSFVVENTAVTQGYSGPTVHAPAVLLDNGSVSGFGNIEAYPRQTRFAFYTTSSSAWIPIANVRPEGGVSTGRIDIYPARISAGTTSFGGTLVFNVSDDGTPASVVTSTQQYGSIPPNSGVWITPARTVGSLLSDGAVRLRINAGVLEMNINVTSGVAVKTETTSV